MARAPITVRNSPHSRPQSYTFAVACGIAGITAISLVALALLLINRSPEALAAMSSTNYRTVNEDITCGGGSRSSTSYQLLDSVCDIAQEGFSSASYRADSGFATQEDIPFITSSLDGHSVAFGTLTTGAISTGSISTTVGTNAPSGYSATIVQDGNLRTPAGDDINPVTDSTVTAGAEEYGIRTSGTDGLFNGVDQGLTTTPVAYASSNGPSSATTTITFKAAISNVTPSGNYKHVVTLVTIGNF